MNESTPVQNYWLSVLFSPTILAVVFILAAAGCLSTWLSTNDIRLFRETLGPAAILVTLPIHVVLALTPFPADVVAIANGAMFGFFIGLPVSCLGWWFAAILQFGLGRRARSDFNLQGSTAKMPSWLRQLPVDHPFYLIGVRQVPWLGMHLGSFVPGATGVDVRRFMWCSAVGVIPGSLLMTLIGAGIVHWGIGW